MHNFVSFEVEKTTTKKEQQKLNKQLNCFVMVLYFFKTKMEICTFSYRFSISKVLLFLLYIGSNILEINAACSLIAPSPKEKQLLEKLEPLKGHTLETQDAVSPANYNYEIKICDKMDGRAEGVGAVQISSNSSFVLGRYDKAEIISGNNWMLLIYYGGATYNSHCNSSEREMHLMIICDPEVLVGKLKIIEERNSNPISCFYLFEVGSNVSCSEKPDIKKGFSSGSVFCILFFTFAILYFAVGFLYKRLIVGAKGLEQIPNYSFWKDFGNLQADGCDYLCRCGIRNESHAYRGIDDDLNTEDERDDSMLNM